MNLKEKLEGYMRDKTILVVGEIGRGYIMYGKIEEVGDDYMVFRQVVTEAQRSWFSDDIKGFKPIGTRISIIQFANLQIKPPPNPETGEEQFNRAVTEDQKRKGK